MAPVGISETLGFNSPKQLVEARKRAVNAGWLHYQRDHDRTVGEYWTLTPQNVAKFDDKPIEDLDDSYSANGTEVGKHSEHGTQSGTQSGTGSGTPPNPIPEPNPIITESVESAFPVAKRVATKCLISKAKSTALAGFDAWYPTYPKKVGRGDAEKAYPKAIADIQATERVGADQAVALLVKWTQERTPSLMQVEKRFRPNPATWLNGKRYRDEIGTECGKSVALEPPLAPHELEEQRIETKRAARKAQAL